MLLVFIVCILVGVVVGSVFMVILMVGIVFFGMGVIMNLNLVLVVGVIISGGIFGDKLLLLLEINNLVLVVVDIDFFMYIKYILWSMLLVGFILLGLFVMLGYSNMEISLVKIN